MKRKGCIKKLLSIVCVLAMLATCVDLPITASADSTNKPIGYTTVLGIEDFIGGEDQKTWSGATELIKAGDETLDGVWIDGIFNISRYASVSIGSQSGYRLMIGVNNSEYLYYQFANSKGIMAGGEAKTFGPGDVGSAYNGKDLRMKIGFTCVYTNEAAGIADVTIRIQFGNSMDEQVLTISGVPMAQFTRCICVNAGNAPVTLKAVKEMTTIGFADFGITEDYAMTGQEVSLSAGYGTLDGIAIDGTYRLDGYPSMQIGVKNGMRLQIAIVGGGYFTYQFLDSTGTAHGYQKLDADTIRCTYRSVDVRIKVGFTFTNVDKEADTADVAIKINVGPLYEDVIEVAGVANVSKLTKTMHFFSNADGATTLTLKTMQPEGIEVTPQDLGVNDGVYEYIPVEEPAAEVETEEPEAPYEEGYTFVGAETLIGADEMTYTAEAKPGNNKSVDGVIIDGTYNFTGNACVYVGTTQWDGLRIQPDGSNLKYWIAPGGSTYDKSVTPTEAGCDLVGQDVHIKVGIRTESTNEDGTANMEYKIWIGDYSTTFILSSVNTATYVYLQRLHVVPGSGSLTVKKTPDPTPYEYTVVDAETLIGAEKVEYTAETKPGNNLSVDGVMLDGLYKFTGNACVYMGTTSWYGLRIQIDGTSNMKYWVAPAGSDYDTSVTPEQAGCTLVDSYVRIKVGIRTVKTNDDGTINVRYTVCIGDYKNTFTVRNLNTANFTYAQRFHVVPGTGTLTIKGAPESLVLGVEDFVKTEAHQVAKGKFATLTAGEGNLDGVTIDGIYHLIGNPVIDFGGTAWKGLQFQRTAAGAKFQFINNASIASVDFTTEETGGIYDTNVRIKVSFEFTSDIAEDNTVNLKIKILVGECEKTLLVTGANVAYLNRAMYWNAPDGPLLMKTTKNREASVLATLQNRHSAANGSFTLDGMVFSGDVQFEGKDTQLRIGGSKAYDWGGAYLRRVNEGTFAFGNLFGMTETTISAEEAGLSSTREKFNLKLEFDFVELDEDGLVNDVRYGVYINDMLYAQTYLYSKNDADRFGVGILAYCPEMSGKLAISTVAPSERDDNTPYILEDFGIEDITYDAESLPKLSVEATKGTEVQGGSSISGKIALRQDASMTLYGAPKNKWFGWRFRMNGDVLEIQHTSSDVSSMKLQVENIKAGETFAFCVEQELLDLDKDGAEDDIRASIRINNELCGNQRFYLLDFASKSEISTVIYTGTKGVGSSDVKVSSSVAVETYDLADTTYGYLVSGEGTITVNDEVVENGTVLSEPGDYIIRSSLEGAYVKQVALYQTADAHADGVADSRDLVASKRALANLRVETKAGQRASDVDGNNVVDAEDYQNIRKNILGKETGITQSIYYTHEQNVMPIVGFYAPCRGVDATGNTYDLITDDIYKLISEAGINIISVGNIDYRTKKKEALDSLALAEKYNIGMYLTDTRYNQMLDAATLAEYQKDFAKYDSYKGTFVVDEPFTSVSGTTEAGRMMSEYADKTEMLNSYSNTLGYINIGPLNLPSDGANYRKHVAEILGPGHKLISWDYYVFDGYAAIGGTNTQGYASPLGYFENLEIMRETSLKEGSPFWGHIQVGSNWDKESKTDNVTPSEAELLWNVNTSLAYGVKGIQYFTLIQPNGFAYIEETGKYDYDQNGIIGANGQPTHWYEYVQSANKQIAAVDEYLLYANTLDVLAIGNAAQEDTEITKTTYGTLLTGVSADNGALVGVFEYQGKTALYVVNYDAYDAETTYDVLPQGDAAADEITLTFGSQKNFTIVSTQLAAEAADGSGTSCTLTLNNGGAALILID